MDAKSPLIAVFLLGSLGCATTSSARVGHIGRVHAGGRASAGVAEALIEIFGDVLEVAVETAAIEAANAPPPSAPPPNAVQVEEDCETARRRVEAMQARPTDAPAPALEASPRPVVLPRSDE